MNFTYITHLQKTGCCSSKHILFETLQKGCLKCQDPIKAKLFIIFILIIILKVGDQEPSFNFSSIRLIGPGE